MRLIRNIVAPGLLPRAGAGTRAGLGGPKADGAGAGVLVGLRSARRSRSGPRSLGFVEAVSGIAATARGSRGGAGARARRREPSGFRLSGRSSSGATGAHELGTGGLRGGGGGTDRKAGRGRERRPAPGECDSRAPPARARGLGERPIPRSLDVSKEEWVGRGRKSRRRRPSRARTEGFEGPGGPGERQRPNTARERRSGRGRAGPQVPPRVRVAVRGHGGASRRVAGTWETQGRRHHPWSADAVGTSPGGGRSLLRAGLLGGAPRARGSGPSSAVADRRASGTPVSPGRGPCIASDRDRLRRTS